MPVIDFFANDDVVQGSGMMQAGDVVNIPGNKTLAEQFIETIEATAPFALWPLSETSGTNADDIAGGFDGTYNANVTLAAITFPDGTPAPLFDATTDVIALPTASLDTPFNPLLGTMAVWLKVRVAGVWTDGVSRIPLSIGVDANNRIFFNRNNFTDNFFSMFYIAGGTTEQRNESSFSPTRWFHVAVTWDKVADEVKYYLDGALRETDTVLGTWVGTLANGFTAIGNFTQSGGANFWDGYIKYPALWNRALTPAEIALLAPAAFQV